MNKIALAYKIAFRARGGSNSLATLGPEDVVTVYHGTDLKSAYSMVNGFDAAKSHPRLYNQGKHRGLFVSPSFKLAESFATNGSIVFELKVRAKFLHGTSYGGTIGRHLGMDEDTLGYYQAKFPGSFRPYLSETLSQATEPQALLVGLVSPRQISRIWYNPGGGGGRWYSRGEFLNLGIGVEMGGMSKTIGDLGYDRSKPNYTLEEFLTLAGKARRITPKKVFDILSKMSLDKRVKTIQTSFKFEPRAAEAFAKLIQGAVAKGV